MERGGHTEAVANILKVCAELELEVVVRPRSSGGRAKAGLSETVSGHARTSTRPTRSGYAAGRAGERFAARSRSQVASRSAERWEKRPRDSSSISRVFAW